MDLLSKAEDYRRRAAHLRKIARKVASVRAHDGLIQAAVTWEQLAATALREAAWEKRINDLPHPERDALSPAPVQPARRHTA